MIDGTKKISERYLLDSIFHVEVSERNERVSRRSDGRTQIMAGKLLPRHPTNKIMVDPISNRISITLLLVLFDGNNNQQ